MSNPTQTTITSAPGSGAPPAIVSGTALYRLTVRQFEKMIDSGVFHNHDHVELLGGLLVDKMVKKDPHNFAIDMLGAILNEDLPPEWIARQEKSVVLGRFWRPEPDIAVASGPRERYRSKAPRRGDLALLVEVADTSYTTDRGVKWRKYAAAGVATYWIVNLVSRQIEVYTAPGGRGRSAGYRNCVVYGADEEVPVAIEGREFGRVRVSEVLA